jgi:hypothetical protein
MTCKTCQYLLQEHLDGAGEAGALEQHVQSCPDCAGEQQPLRRFLDGVALLTPALPPAGLADRIASEVCAEVSRERRRLLRRRLTGLAALAAAASVLVVVGGRRWLPTSPPANPVEPVPSVVQLPERESEPTRPLRDSMAEASTAVAAITTRAANETMDQTASLLPMLPAPTLEPLSAVPAPIAPLREASAGVSAGLSPVADSARRAVGLFLRDLPMGLSDRPAGAKIPG